jgi:hypothetical protein
VLVSRQHAENSARLANATQPEFLCHAGGEFPHGRGALPRRVSRMASLCDEPELFAEMERFIGALELRRTVFRADHVSNRLVLKGNLGAEKPRLLNEIRVAMDHPDQARLRPLWQRGL